MKKKIWFSLSTDWNLIKSIFSSCLFNIYFYATFIYLNYFVIFINASINLNFLTFPWNHWLDVRFGSNFCCIFVLHLKAIIWTKIQTLIYNLKKKIQFQYVCTSVAIVDYSLNIPYIVYCIAYQLYYMYGDTMHSFCLSIFTP